MKTRSHILVTALVVLAACFASCSNDDSKALQSKKGIDKTVQIEHGDFLELGISNGAGNYMVTSSDSLVATAIADWSVLRIKGLKEGKTILTVTDKSDRTLNIAVTVTGLDKLTNAAQ